MFASDKVGYINVLMGLVAVGAGFSGRFGLPGKPFEAPIIGGPEPLWILGGLIVAHGIYQIYRSRPR